MKTKKLDKAKIPVPALHTLKMTKQGIASGFGSLEERLRFADNPMRETQKAIESFPSETVVEDAHSHGVPSLEEHGNHTQRMLRGML